MLGDALTGKEIKQVRPEGLRRVVGATVTAVEPTGKHLIIRFDNGYALHSHMRMRGIWHVYWNGEKWHRPEWRMKAMLATETAVAVCFDAPVVELMRNTAPVIGHLGPDILAGEWDVTEVIKRARQLNQTPIGEVMLDQRVTSGIGNVYRCEALWRQLLNPWKKTQELTDEELTNLFATARDAMRANLASSTWRRSFPGYGRGAVHGRAGRPCPRCGALIQRRGMGENVRTVYWCPRCQA